MALAAKIDFGSISVIDVARELLGPENRERSTAEEKHFPDHAGLFVNTKINNVYSHGNEVGGDAVDLIRYVKQCEFPAARSWLSAQGFINGAPQGKAPPPHRRELITSYSYTDENGEVVYTVDRWSPKW